MSKVSSRSVFRCDYTDIEAVKKLARKLGKGQTVYKHPDRPNYNITHTARKDRYEPEWVVYQT